MSCQCIDNANRQLRDEGHALATLMSCGQHGKHPRVLLRTTFGTSSKPLTHPLHPPIVAATYCPLCGTKYED